MELNQCCIKAPADSEWTVITDCTVVMSVARRIQRTIVRGNEGDDIIDEGSESAMFTVTGPIDLEQFRMLLKIYRTGDAVFVDPFEEKEANAIISKLEFDGSKKEFVMVILEDVDIEW